MRRMMRLLLLAREMPMDARPLVLSLALLASPMAAVAADGLATPRAETLWPQWQARISVQTAAVSPLALTSLADQGAVAQAWQGAAVLGDYYFATPSIGSFRASGGLMMGAQGGAPRLAASAGPRLGLAVQSGDVGGLQGAENNGLMTYLGLGFSTTALRHSLTLTADLGLVAGRPGAAGGVGRAVFGNQGMEDASRELRLSPLLQVGMRYSF
jgi:hypothetical protein